MHIVFAASECVPFAKTGGLADVVGALPPELVKLGHQVSVYIPLYRTVRPFLPEQLTFAVRSITIPFEYYNRFAGIVDGGLRDGVQYYFVDCPELFDRDGFYGPRSGAGDYGDNAERFGLFCRAVLEASKQLGVPDIFHVHDWQAAMLPVYLHSVYYFDPALRTAGTVLTIHNAGYQGWFPPSTTPQLLLPWDMFTVDKVEQNDTFNFLKGGLVYSDYLTTVSPTYAKEIQTGEFGAGLDGLLRKRHWDLRGILNGVDYAHWNPAHDPKLAAHYSPENLAGKAECRRDLLHAFGLEGVQDDTAIIGIVSRFATQKGFDLVSQIADQMTDRNLAVVALGSGEPYYENFFRSWAQRKPVQVAVQVRYDDALAHKVEAGADMFLMPSRYEPCGLNQIYSLKYGTVPVVRATGGLEDTIEEWNADNRTGTGFKFSGYHAGDLLWAIDRALWVFANDKPGWQTLMRNGMAKDYAWAHPAREYVEVYEEVLRRRG
ncbi:glycogen synthase GlgA [Acidicapsa ligni]|uniref:glycogen synthase GlgA n=1 Tax=Acidicapsa ligni TaxID=542300 RepID=UPI0021DFE72C|nr:glycogen synthase GlgA [Acidicapsa ligni]